ncbi:MAG: CBS domain-containing protein [Calditrichaeota bacterium]|nr:MAG: CBS domain-containing protein [Calditrichota bacterium]
MRIKNILEKKGNKVYSIHQNQPVYEAIKELVKQNIGALLVHDDDHQIVGILSERDILREGSQNCEKLHVTPIKEVMTVDLIICRPEDEITYAKQVMVKNRIRHLPIFDEGKIVGVVSMRDVVEQELKEFTVENRYLRDYIEGKYPA